MAYIVWTKQYTASDEGSILYAVNLGSIQNDIASVINGGITDINISNTAAIAASKVAGIAGSTYTRTFTNADLVAGILTVTHNMGVKYVTGCVYDNNDKWILADEITVIDTLSATIALNSYGTIVGTWNVRFSI